MGSCSLAATRRLSVVSISTAVRLAPELKLRPPQRILALEHTRRKGIRGALNGKAFLLGGSAGWMEMFGGVYAYSL